MRRRLLALVCVSASVLSGCGLISQDGGGDRHTVTVWLMKDSASQDFLKRFTEGFEADHPDLDLDIRIQEWTGIGDKVQAALKADGSDGPDVIEVGNTQVPQYAEGGRLQDLTLESMRDWGIRDWLPGLAEPGQWMSQQFGVPWYAANRVVIYRKDLFERAGINEPPRTREEWLDATEKLDKNGDQGIYLAGQDWYTLSGFIWDEGGELATQAGEGGVWTGALDSGAALRGMDFYRELQALGDGPVDADEEHPPQAGVFAKGQVAQIIAVPGQAQSVLRENPDLKGKIGFFPVPGKSADKPGAVFTGGSDLVVPKNTDQEEGALAVVEALAGEKWNTDLARTMNYVPNKKTLAEAVSGEEGAEAMAAGAAQGRATPGTPQWGAVEADNPIKAYMTKVLKGADAKSEARKASDRITELLDPNTR
ncbi:extracellular solute-binding protein [Streptomyces sp. KPB2]|uniref:extracellular solute-binding protein n=1 Tax=Streptomyces TaxID=1883 RepID=UPI000F7162FC|nr:MULTISPECIES: extracellular solute-binding protein [Streptomyces]AZM74045.1 extracellular solute-binding protein [Streptomyces sp. KPB2]MBH5129761.1 extracellular solute-binding protein [Streptomyces sp. HB-N217]QKW59536.1 extracellular solute-binding protein [Streptomyces sp. NA03103]WST99722.1 extracellular solute-binding protein [Streptomyces sp. NBC_01124]